MKDRVDTSLSLFTQNYPYGIGETFLESEIKILSKKFKYVYIHPFEKADGLRQVPENCEIIELPYGEYKMREVLSKDLKAFLGIYSKEFFSGINKLRDWKNIASRLLRYIHRSYSLASWINKQKFPLIYYSYWFNAWVTILAVLHRKKIINTFVSRGHRHDIYESEHDRRYIPFVNFHLKHIACLSLISKHGFDYMSARYPAYKEKFTLNYLGTEDHGRQLPLTHSKPLLIVSVSCIRKVKRVNLIIDTLMKVKRNVQWIHFGDGDCEDEVMPESEKLPENIKCRFMGRRGNAEILGYLKNNDVGLFLNVSESEGLPVSIMEAVSFGIPVFATDVGGTSEIVNNITGKLFPKDFSAEVLAKAIDEFDAEACRSDDNVLKIRRFWQDKFSAERNHTEFISKILKGEN
jgi:glycosyltransferase involved in cell wall biosynthesis